MSSLFHCIIQISSKPAFFLEFNSVKSSNYGRLVAKMKTIVLVGVPGCGKSSILKETVRQIPSVVVVNYGDKMLEEAALTGITRDTLRKMPLSAQQEIGIKAAKKLIRQQEQIAIIDTHALIRTEIGFCPGLPKEVLHILSPRALVWIECQPFLILQRRMNDSSRTRDEETEEELLLHQELVRSYLAACSMETGALLCRLSNSDLSLENNCQPLVRLVRQLSK